MQLDFTEMSGSHERPVNDRSFEKIRWKDHSAFENKNLNQTIVSSDLQKPTFSIKNVKDDQSSNKRYQRKQKTQPAKELEQHLAVHQSSKQRVKMKKVTIIRQQKQRDGSVQRAKQQVYGLSLGQAVQSVKNETRKTF